MEAVNLQGFNHTRDFNEIVVQMLGFIIYLNKSVLSLTHVLSCIDSFRKIIKEFRTAPATFTKMFLIYNIKLHFTDNFKFFYCDKQCLNTRIPYYSSD